MQSNPIQQRIDLICEKWEEAKKCNDARIVRIQCQADEEDMIDTFYTYMIGVDTPILDIAFHFDSHCTAIKQFSTQLVKELEEIVGIWNNSEKDKRIGYVAIQWKPDYTLLNDKNPAAMFVQNFNHLAEEMDLGEDLFAVAIFKAAVTDENLSSWLKYAVEATISDKVKFLIHDSFAKRTFHSLAILLAPVITTIPLNLNMPKAMEQVAAMGDPNDPATFYRIVFMKMINAMGAGKESEAEKWGCECIDIANRNLSKDPYWIMQVVVIYVALANDKMRYKRKKEILAYANKAVETAIASQVYFENNVSSVLMAQTMMFRGTVFFVQDNFGSAWSDLSIAFETYRKHNNMPLAIEACRMAGKSALKISQKTNAVKLLAEGARMGKNMNREMAQASTYAGLLELLFQNIHMSIIPLDEVREIAQNVYGSDWSKVISNWKKTPDKSVLKQQELEAAQE